MVVSWALLLLKKSRILPKMYCNFVILTTSVSQRFFIYIVPLVSSTTLQNGDFTEQITETSEKTVNLEEAMPLSLKLSRPGIHTLSDPRALSYFSCCCCNSKTIWIKVMTSYINTQAHPKSQGLIFLNICTFSKNSDGYILIRANTSVPGTILNSWYVSSHSLLTAILCNKYYCYYFSF